jgi:hypothetical protein
MIALNRDHPGPARRVCPGLAGQPWVLFPRVIAPLLYDHLRLCRQAVRASGKAAGRCGRPGGRWSGSIPAGVCGWLAPGGLQEHPSLDRTEHDQPAGTARQIVGRSWAARRDVDLSPDGMRASLARITLQNVGRPLPRALPQAVPVMRASPADSWRKRSDRAGTAEAWDRQEGRHVPVRCSAARLPQVEADYAARPPSCRTARQTGEGRLDAEDDIRSTTTTAAVEGRWTGAASTAWLQRSVPADCRMFDATRAARCRGARARPRGPAMRRANPAWRTAPPKLTCALAGSAP